MSSSKGALVTRPRRPPQADAKSQFIENGVDKASPLLPQQDAPAAQVAAAEVVTPKREERNERVVVYLTKDEIKRIRLYAIDQDLKLTHIFRDAVMALVEAHEREGK